MLDQTYDKLVDDEWQKKYEEDSIRKRLLDLPLAKVNRRKTTDSQYLYRSLSDDKLA